MRLSVLLVVLLVAPPSQALAQRVLDIEYTPTRRAQIAVWITRDDGTFLRTLSLTQAVSRFGIGNRPGALQMNSGFVWPYGRREGVLPIWAHARLTADGARPFRRVIFQDRVSEGHASVSTSDFSGDDHFCLAWGAERSRRDGLDAVTCASQFRSDKGRYITAADVADGYLEPAESAPGVHAPHVLGLTSLYPPRRDVARCTLPGCFDHEDVDRYVADAREVMPELDAITSATPPGDVPQRLMFTVPDDWDDGTYLLHVEVNVEGDYGPGWTPEQFPTPGSSDSRPPRERWDIWALTYGYPYRGQPSVVYVVPVEVGEAGTASATAPIGHGSLEGRGPDGGAITPIDGTIVDDPIGAPGSGADRLRADASGLRLRVGSRAAEACTFNRPPTPIQGLVVSEHAERRNAHRYAHLAMVAPSDDVGIALYEVRFAESPIADEASFLAARPANAASREIEALQMPLDVPPGGPIEVEVGGLSFERRYWFAVRAIDTCNAASDIAVTEYTTPPVVFTTVAPCFVATAAYGTPMAGEVSVLRRFRDRHLLPSSAGRALVEAYYAASPPLARWIAGDEDRRATARLALGPVVALARWLDS